MRSRKTFAANKINEANSRIPEFMRADLDKGKESIGPSDVLWSSPGDEALPQDMGPFSAIELILMAVIAPHPSKSSKTARLDAALKGVFGRGKDGPKVLADDDLLMHMARSLHMDHFRFSGRDRPIAELARQAIKMLPADHPMRRRSAEDSQIRRLTKKFKVDIDKLMPRVTSGDLPETMGRWRLRREIYERLIRLGISVDPDVDPRPDLTTHQITS